MMNIALRLCPSCGSFYQPTGNRQKWCKRCGKRYNKDWQRAYKQLESSKLADKGYHRKHCSTLRGYLGRLYNNINQRCNNPSQKSYKNYGGQGILNKFDSSKKFREYVINTLGIGCLEQLKGLQIDRIDNQGHYESGNIRFVTHLENQRNKG